MTTLRVYAGCVEKLVTIVCFSEQGYPSVSSTSHPQQQQEHLAALSPIGQV